MNGRGLERAEGHRRKVASSEGKGGRRVRGRKKGRSSNALKAPVAGMGGGLGKEGGRSREGRLMETVGLEMGRHPLLYPPPSQPWER